MPADRAFCPACGLELATWVSPPPTVPVVVPRLTPQPDRDDDPRGVPLAVAAVLIVLIAVIGVGGGFFLLSRGGGGGPTPPPDGPTAPPDNTAEVTDAPGVSDTPTDEPVDGFTVGDYRGWKPQDAKLALATLCPSDPCVDVVFDPEQGPVETFGLVLRTEPAANEQVAAGDTVHVLVSTGDFPTDGSWYEVTPEDNQGFLKLANEHGYNPGKTLASFNPGININHISVGDLIWIPTPE